MFARRSALRLARAWVLRPLEAGRGPALPPRALSFAAAQPPPRGNFGSLLPTAARSAGQSATRLLHVASPDQQPGARSAATAESIPNSYMMYHPVYSPDELDVTPDHRPTEGFRDSLAHALVGTARFVFDKGTGYKADARLTEAAWLQRFIFLETVAAVPGMVGGAVRHLHSLRLMRGDGGWINTLLEEAENERMHLLTFVKLRNPGPLFRATVLVAQGVLYNAFFLAYLLSPKTVHRFVGYLEEEAVKTYTHALRDLDDGHLPGWATMPPPVIAKEYWQLGEGATMRDLLLAVRADEAAHSHVNHTLASLPQSAVNPFRGGATKLPLPDFTRPPPGVDMATGRPVFANAPPSALGDV